ncbi:hypothetical protein QBC35DRAFT_523196 [Podospora australis]|uniref:Anaphase-promoting complex subunit 2 n=1 Tax=Podospora australis TaxID=1536484 RepID=A0AAN7AI05_9PEZI|nr:hypothetical protein QBC35DRAFT_523196 [Podospora australis]
MALNIEKRGAVMASPWRQRRNKLFQSVFQTDVPHPQSTPRTSSPSTSVSSINTTSNAAARFADQGQPLGGSAASNLGDSFLFVQQQSQPEVPAPQRHQRGKGEYGYGHHYDQGQGYRGYTALGGDADAPSSSATLRDITPEPLFQRTAASASASAAAIVAGTTAAAPPQYPPSSSLATTAAVSDDQRTYDRAWQVVTTHLAMQSPAADTTAAAPASQRTSLKRSTEAQFLDALSLVTNAKTLLPRAVQTGNIVAWHTQQVRAHFAQHVVPLLKGCLEGEDTFARHSGAAATTAVGGSGTSAGKKARATGGPYERHMFIVKETIHILEEALQLYFTGHNELLAGLDRVSSLSQASSIDTVVDTDSLNARFRRDVHALVTNSASEALMKSIEIVLTRLASTILIAPGARGHGNLPVPPHHGDVGLLKARDDIVNLVAQLHNVGLTGERFEVLFGEVMNKMMSRWVTQGYAGIWTASSSPNTARSFSQAINSVSRVVTHPATSLCIRSLNNWVENHFAQLSVQVLSFIGAAPMSLSDLKTSQSLALGRLAALRIDELFDIVLAWPRANGALEDLRATIMTPARRQDLAVKFSRALQKRLLHPGCSTLEILRTYIAIINTLHAIDHSKVLLSKVEPALQLYLCQRDDAVRVVVSGLLASADDIREAIKAGGALQRPTSGTGLGGGGVSGAFTTPNMQDRSTTPTRTSRRRRDSASSVVKERPALASQPSRKVNKLVELAQLLNDPSQSRRPAAVEDDHELDWDDMNWVPDPVDAGDNYKRPKNVDVIGTLISALGSEDVFIKEFAAVVAERLLGEPSRFDQELRVLDLLKRRFGEPALQNCDVMIRDVQDSQRLDEAIRKTKEPQLPMMSPRRPRNNMMVTPDRGAGGSGRKRSIRQPWEEEADDEDTKYHARILSRLFWPNLDREHFLLPPPIVEQQKEYEQGYESLKSGRKLTWLNQLGQTRVELELRDRTVTVDCSPAEATVIYAFQGPDTDGEYEDGYDHEEEEEPVKKAVEDLYMDLQMDEDLITAACEFWVGKGVLRKVSGENGGEYVVVESLGGGGAAAPTGAPQEEQPQEEEQEAAGPSKAAAPALSAKEKERREMYWRYIQGMLTNASATMPLGQMAMMMKMLIADGFPWSNEELQEFLGEKVAAGEMEVVGGKYKLVKK